MDERTMRERNGRLAGLLREQLNSMMAAAYGLGENLPPESKEAEYLAVINRNLCRQLRIVRRLELEHKLSSEDEIRLNIAPVDLVAMCRELMDEVEGLVSPLGIKTRFETRQEEFLVCADRFKLESMLLFLVSNSVKAIAGHGGSGEMTLGLERREGQAVFLLSDNGGGATAEAVAQFFDCAEEECDVPEEPAMGVGLPLVRKIAALHGGIALADNYEGRGMRMAVTISAELPGSGWDLKTPRPEFREESWGRAAVELSEILPTSFFAPKEFCE